MSRPARELEDRPAHKRVGERNFVRVFCERTSAGDGQFAGPRGDLLRDSLSGDQPFDFRQPPGNWRDAAKHDTGAPAHLTVHAQHDRRSSSASVQRSSTSSRRAAPFTVMWIADRGTAGSGWTSAGASAGTCPSMAGATVVATTTVAAVVSRKSRREIPEGSVDRLRVLMVSPAECRGKRWQKAQLCPQSLGLVPKRYGVGKLLATFGQAPLARTVVVMILRIDLSHRRLSRALSKNGSR